MTKSLIKAGDVVKHFKRDDYLKEKYGDNIVNMGYDASYLYEVLYTDTTHTETKEKLVIYQALFNSPQLGVKLFQIFAQPFDMFMSKVDKKQYPNVKQEWCFEKYNAEKEKNEIRNRYKK